jgi:hypothetical protein
MVGRTPYRDAWHRDTVTWTLGTLVGALVDVLPAGRLALLVHLGGDAVSSALTLGGLALIPLLWRPLSPKGAVGVRWTYAAWLVLVTVLTVADLSAWWHLMSQPLPDSASSSPFLTMSAPYLVPGAAVFPLGLLVSCAALLLLLKQPLPTSAPALVPRTGWQATAALVLTLGVLVWGIGFYLMPEAVTAACSPVSFSVTQFAHGACAGLDSDQVLQDAYNADLNPIARLLFTVGRHFELLVAAGGITALGGWTRRLSVPMLAWLAAWPVLALGVALVALLGVGVVAQHGFQLTAATATGWHMGSGMVVTFVGIGLVALGQIGLWRELVRRHI